MAVHTSVKLSSGCVDVPVFPYFLIIRHLWISWGWGVKKFDNLSKVRLPDCSYFFELHKKGFPFLETRCLDKACMFLFFLFHNYLHISEVFCVKNLLNKTWVLAICWTEVSFKTQKCFFTDRSNLLVRKKQKCSFFNFSWS